MTTESVYLGDVAHVVYQTEDTPTLTNGNLHVFVKATDDLGSTSVVLDRDTGELVEARTYQGFGAVESDYRPERWASYREPRSFQDNNDDIEVGLTYFGARYYSPYLMSWISADPLTVHALGSTFNPYAFVAHSPIQGIDGYGLDEEGGLSFDPTDLLGFVGLANAVVGHITIGGGRISGGHYFNPASVLKFGGKVAQSDVHLATTMWKGEVRGASKYVVNLAVPATLAVPYVPPAVFRAVASGICSTGQSECSALTGVVDAVRAAQSHIAAPPPSAPLVDRFLDSYGETISPIVVDAFIIATSGVFEGVGEPRGVTVVAGPGGGGGGGGVGGGGLPATANICRGGTCTAELFTKGATGVDPTTKQLSGVSVNSAPGLTVKQLSANLPNKQIGTTTVASLPAPGTITPKPTATNAYHCEICGLTAAELEKLFTPTIRNPNIP
jgi:RHS repeat-associated protein